MGEAEGPLDEFSMLWINEDCDNALDNDNPPFELKLPLLLLLLVLLLMYRLGLTEIGEVELKDV